MERDHEQQELAPPPAKLDPETLTLRAQPARAIRFKRGAVVAIAGAASASVIATAWIALKPASFRVVGQPDDQAISAKAPGDTLSGLPTSYGDVPKLGPPLPGDLGRPILDRERQMATETAPNVAPPSRSTGDIAKEQGQAQAKAAGESALLFQTSNKSTFPAPAATTVGAPSPAEPMRALDPERDPNDQLRKSEFAFGHDRDGPVEPHTMMAARSPYTLSAGSVVAASLITGIRSDLPGLVTAQVTERVYDSATGRIELIPQGARLIGTYDSVVAFGQRRALVVWQRIIMPDGSSMQIDSVPATDVSGYAGLAGNVDFHTWTLLKGVVLSTLLGVSSSLTFTGESDLVQAIRESTQQNVSRAGDQLTAKNLQVQPTITISPGTPVRLVVHRDLILVPWRR